MDVEVPVLSGFLTIPTQSGFSLNRISKKKSSNPKYCLLFKSSRHGIERLEICETKDDKNPKIITLENCVKITQENTSAVFIINVVTKTETLTLNAQNEDDLKNWVIALKSVAFRDKNNRSACNSTVIEEHNDLYCSSYGENYFTVQLIPSDTSVRCNFQPKSYTLLLTATELQLKSFEEDKKLVAKWPYRYIRKYGYRDGKFTFEAGRKCDTGEGMFILDHNCPQEIFRCMGAKMQSMKKLMNGESMASLDCGENQLNAALSMEPGSRSPLPPSPNHISASEMDISASIRCFLLNDSASNSSSSSAPLIISNNKHIPNKPPRKALNLVIGNNSFTTSEKSTTFCSPTDETIKPSSEKYRRFQNYEPITPISMSNENIKPGSLHVVKSAPDIKTTCIIKNNLHSPSSPQLPNLPEPNKIRNLSSPSIPLSPTNISNNNSNNVNNNNNNVNNNNNSSNNNNNISNNNNNNNTNNSYKKLTEVTVTGDDRDYESIQNITEAWKTLGIDDVKHTEHVKTPEDDLVEFVWQRSKSLQETIEKDKIMPPPVMRIVEIDPDGNYDRLQFFGTNNKTKLPSPGYKTIISVISPSGCGNNNNTIKSISDDYEIVGSPDTQSCRLADDSYLGYGVLRKPSIPGQLIASGITTTIIDDNDDGLGLDHQKYNGLDYAVISKPKRV